MCYRLLSLLCVETIAGDDSADGNVIVNAWFGPEGTVSPCHHDPYDNLLSQVVGSKYIRIYHPSESSNLYPHSSGKMTNTSQVDVEHPDLLRFPNTSKATYLECVLSAGEMLYIPPKFWHYIRSLECSFSCSFWWKGREAVT